MRLREDFFWRSDKRQSQDLTSSQLTPEYVLNTYGILWLEGLGIVMFVEFTFPSLWYVKVTIWKGITHLDVHDPGVFVEKQT